MIGKSLTTISLMVLDGQIPGDTLFMLVPRCDTCAHWTNEFSSHGYYCNRVFEDENKAWTDHEYLFTEPDFGCVQWETK